MIRQTLTVYAAGFGMPYTHAYWMIGSYVAAAVSGVITLALTLMAVYGFCRAFNEQ